MKPKVYTSIAVVAALLLAWSGKRFVMSPIGVFWHLPLLTAAVSLFIATFVTDNCRLAFVSGTILVCLAGGAGIFSLMALIAGSPSLTAFSSIATAVFGTMATLQAGMEVSGSAE